MKRTRQFTVEPAQSRRLDQFLAEHLEGVSRARVQELIAQGTVLVEGRPAKPSLKLHGGEHIELLAAPERPPLRAIAEDIPLEVLYEDADLAVINKPAGMMVHAGAGATDDARNRGTLVNALLHRFGSLSAIGGQVRPGIVHRLDRNTSGLIVVAKHDLAHRRLAEQFAGRRVHKRYIALVHGWPRSQRGTIENAISRDPRRRTRMTTRRHGGRAAISHYSVRRKLHTLYGRFALIEVEIETGRTHQIRVHMSSLGHPVVGDTLYGAARELKSGRDSLPVLALGRNFLHAAAIQFEQPLTGKPLVIESPLPGELQEFLSRLELGSQKGE